MQMHTTKLFVNEYVIIKTGIGFLRQYNQSSKKWRVTNMTQQNEMLFRKILHKNIQKLLLCNVNLCL